MEKILAAIRSMEGTPQKCTVHLRSGDSFIAGTMEKAATDIDTVIGVIKFANRDIGAYVLISEIVAVSIHQ